VPLVEPSFSFAEERTFELEPLTIRDVVTITIAEALSDRVQAINGFPGKRSKRRKLMK
jgi:hypothetical protein